MFTVQLFGRDTVGKRFQRDLDASFPTCEAAINAAERAVANSGNSSLVKLTNYRISSISGATVLDVGACGSQRRLTHGRAAAWAALQFAALSAIREGVSSLRDANGVDDNPVRWLHQACL